MNENTKKCKYCKQIKPTDQFVKILAWRRKCCNSCYQLPFLKKQREKDQSAVEKRRKYCEYYEEHCRKRQSIEKELYQSAKRRSKKHGLHFDLNHIDISVPKFCPVLGIPIRQAKNRMDDYSPTIDRLNPKFGYVKENICVMSNRANRIKSNGSIEEHEKVIKFMKDKGLTNIKSVI